MLEIGSVLDGKYKILNKVGQGGMSVVYLAMNEKANKQWAVKEVRKDGVLDFEAVRQGLVAETDILKRLSHPGLPSIIDVIDDNESFLIVMDYIEGNPLSKALEEYGAQPESSVIEWAKELCDVLGYLHTRTPKIIYRDMKPANVMLKPDGHLTLIDFGTAREYKEKNLADTTCLGTIGYAAPEQFGGMGQTDERTDIYCLGATLYHLVTGMNPSEPPYEMRPIRQINPALSSGLEEIILKCTQRNPDDRYQSTAELKYALDHYQELDYRFRGKQKRKLGLFIGALALSFVFAGVSVWGYFTEQRTKNSNYDEIMRTATSAEEYTEAILSDPTRVDAYLALNNELIDDFDLSRSDAQMLLKLWAGLDQTDSRGYTTTVNVLGALKETDPEGYDRVCYEIGESFLFYYDLNIDRDRYGNAAKWFNEVRDRNDMAELYCNISECLDLINQYNGARVKQTEKMYEQYDQLWKMLSTLKKSADSNKSMDSRLQVWEEINTIIRNNVAPFLEVTSADEVISLLEDISAEAGKIDKSVLQGDIQRLLEEIGATIEKIRSA